MQNLLRFILRYRIILVLLLLQFTGLALTYRSSPIHQSFYWDRVLQTQATYHKTTEGWEHYFDLTNTNLSLQEENAQLRSRISIPDPNAQLAVDSGQYQWMTSQVVYSSINLRNNHLILNKGREDGVQPGQGVLSADGILGVISHTSAHFSKVISILHSEARISGSVKHSGFFGTIVWNGGAPHKVQFEDLPIESNVHIGDTVVTDTRSAIFPGGWPIGVVVSVETDSASFTQLATLKICGSLGRQQPAYIVKNLLAREQQTLLAP
jgi:rod shape-determining protein MreC